MEVPESLKHNKEVFPYIQRSRELEEINPVISYYCKLYALESIISQKLTSDKLIEPFVIELLDVTEAAKKDEELNKVLSDKNISVNVGEIYYGMFPNVCDTN